MTDLEVDDAEKGLRIRLRRGASDGVHAPPTVQVLGGAAPAGVPAAAPAAAAPAEDDPAEDAPAAEAINSPMVGTFYRSSSPDADPFARVGDKCSCNPISLMNRKSVFAIVLASS